MFVAVCSLLALFFRSSLPVPPTVLSPQGRALTSKTIQAQLWQPSYKDADEEPPRPLTDDDGPWHEDWSNSLAICASMKHENITDVQEWLQYYKYASWWYL